MPKKLNPKQDIILFVGTVSPRSKDYFDQAVKSLESELSRKLHVIYIVEKRKQEKSNLPSDLEIIRVNTLSAVQLEKALLPIQDRLLAITSYAENNIPYLRNVIPHVPYLLTPTMESLNWANDKISMRRRFRAYNPKISPNYSVVYDTKPETINRVVKKLGFPCIIKPSGLAASVLVTVCYDREELEKSLKQVLGQVKRVYRIRGRLTEPKVLVEQYFEGTLYSTDIYIDAFGNTYPTPLTHITTGQDAGREDFYGYIQRTPAILPKRKQDKAIDVAIQGVHALGLRNTISHVELLKTNQGWKLVEIGARMGGFRNYLYEKAYGIDHGKNDLLIRIGKKPKIKQRIISHANVMKMYPKTEGKIIKISGLEEIQRLESYQKHDQNSKVGDEALFALHGGMSVIDVYLANKDRSKLIADNRRVEKLLDIQVTTQKLDINQLILEADQKSLPVVENELPTLTNANQILTDREEEQTNNSPS